MTSPLSSDRWRVLSPYLDEALEMATADRATWLAAISMRDPALADDLNTLLAEHDALHASSFLEGAVPVAARPAVTPSLAGHTLGAYRLVSPIGQGGMGSVWLAERCDGRFKGRAAVKLLNIALVGRAGEERFRREGNILARLTHRHIARLIDAGVSDAGQPYLVLEHVDGEGIDRYCDTHALGIEARLQLFLDVLGAVAHAHTHLIVHRDIKPANVLVSKTGEVKLLDFGIAKLLEGDGQWRSAIVESNPLTRDGGALLTPEYAAPEQLAHGEITTATDVYALGVLLYVLLTGQHPAGAATGSPAALVRAIIEQEPRRISDAVVARQETAEAVTRHAGRCGTTAHRLRRTLQGDLDTIVAKALKKNAAERYPSVSALADDLRRFLRREPLSARPDTLRYRTASFVRRHKRAVMSAATVLVLVAGLTTFYTSRLAAERDRAQRETAKAVKVSELLMGLLTNVDPYALRESRGEPTPRGLLDAATEQFRKDLAGQPELQAELLTMMGRTYRRLGVYAKAQSLLEEALVSGRRAFGDEHVRVAQTLDYLGVVLADKGDYAGAGRTLEQALEMQRRLLGEHADVAVTLAELGRVYQDQGWNARAEPLHREALAMRRKVLGEDHRETAVSLSDVASVLRLNGDLAGSEALLQQSLETNRKTRGEDHPNTSTALHDLALIAASRGEYRSATPLFRHVLATQRRTLGQHHPIVATTLNNLSHVLVKSGRYDEAATTLQEALDIVRPALGSDHQLVGIYTTNLGSLQLARKQPAAAEPLLREGLRIRRLAPGVVPSRRRTVAEDDQSVAAINSLLGASLVALGRYGEAESVLLEAQRQIEQSPAPRPQEVKAVVTRLVDLYTAWRKPAVAASYRARLASL